MGPLRRALLSPRTAATLRTPHRLWPAAARAIHRTAALSLPYKDDQDRESLKPRKQEETRSGTVDDVAHADAAFDPSKTRPEEAKDAAAKGGSGGHDESPLEVSGANQDMAGATTEPESARDARDSKRRSGGGSGQKGGKVTS